MSAAVPCIGMFLATRSPKARVLKLELLSSGERAAAAEERLYIALLLRLGDDALHVFAHAAVLLEVGVDVGLRLLGAHADVLREREGADAVHDAEVDGLRVAALLGRHLGERHAEDLRGGDGVDVLAAQEGVLHRLVPGDVREQAELYLAVVRVHEHAAGRGDEHPAYLAAELAAHGYVL